MLSMRVMYMQIVRGKETYGEGIINGLHHSGKVEVVEVVFHLDLGKTGGHGNTTLDCISVVQPAPAQQE